MKIEKSEKSDQRNGKTERKENAARDNYYFTFFPCGFCVIMVWDARVVCVCGSMEHGIRHVWGGIEPTSAGERVQIKPKSRLPSASAATRASGPPAQSPPSPARRSTLASIASRRRAPDPTMRTPSQSLAQSGSENSEAMGGRRKKEKTGVG